MIEPTLYKGYWGDILVLCLVYVDDILLATTNKETNQQLLDFLTGRLKVKLTGGLEEDGRIGFLGREIIQCGRDVLLAVKKEYVESIFEAFGWNREARKKMKACTVPPDLRSVLDKEDPAKPSEELSPEAASRYRSTLGKLGWLGETSATSTHCSPAGNRVPAPSMKTVCAKCSDGCLRCLTLCRSFRRTSRQSLALRPFQGTATQIGPPRGPRDGRALVEG